MTIRDIGKKIEVHINIHIIYTHIHIQPDVTNKVIILIYTMMIQKPFTKPPLQNQSNRKPQQPPPEVTEERREELFLEYPFPFNILQEVRKVLIPAGLVVSCVFLAATLLCQLCVAPLRDRHGLCLAAYVAALLVADATLFLTQAFSKYLSPSICVFVGE